MTSHGQERHANRSPGVGHRTDIPTATRYSEWAARWWNWTLSMPDGENPAVSTDPSLAGNGQHGLVWFRAGTFDSDPKLRVVRVPAGKALFLPIINNVWLQFPTDPPIDEDCAERNYYCLRALISPAVDAATADVTIDGVPLVDPARYRENSVVFEPTVPEGAILGSSLVVRMPCMDAGLYLMLAPLSMGKHTIVAKVSTGAFSLEVTYQIMVR